MFRDLIPLLADQYYVVAPDLPGFGFSAAPDRTQLRYTFDSLTKTVDGFTEAIGLKRYAIYVFDYGAPIGFRLAVAHPERVTTIISQNGNAYQEGRSQGWNTCWRELVPRHELMLVPGGFGENLTTEGFDEDHVAIGAN
jgi:pimeloyl-ACP methyl ester carboxylesterase